MYEMQQSTFGSTFVPSKERLMTIVTSWSGLYLAFVVEGMFR
jgi:hypothetical protein